MGLRYRDLMTHVAVECMAGPAPECAGCTQSAREPNCGKSSQNQNQTAKPNCPKASAGKPPKKRLDGLGELREQLRAELRA